MPADPSGRGRRRKPGRASWRAAKASGQQRWPARVLVLEAGLPVLLGMPVWRTDDAGPRDIPQTRRRRWNG